MSDLLVILVLAVPLLVLWAWGLWDIVRSRHDLTRGGRAVWVLALLFLPVVALAAYLVTRPPRGRRVRPLHEENLANARQIVAVAEQHRRGELTDDEYRSAMRSLTRRSP